jgi:hypothetical protein
MNFRLTTRCGIKDEIHELYLLKANPVNMPITNQATRLPSDTGMIKKCPRCAIVKIPALINTLILEVVYFFICR